MHNSQPPARRRQADEPFGDPVNITITLLFRKAIRPIPGCAAGPPAAVNSGGVYSTALPATTGGFGAYTSAFFGPLAPAFLAVFFAAAFFGAAGPSAFAASAFCRRYSAHLFRVASTMRLRPAALIFRFGLGALAAAAGCLAFCAAAACFR